MTKKLILIEPTYPIYSRDKLFAEKVLNRDDCLAPIIRLKEQANILGYELHTADYLQEVSKSSYESIDYYSFGMVPDFKRLEGINLKGYLLMEPPVVQPNLYEQLPVLTKYFENVYVHNTEGGGYSLKNITQNRLRKFYWPQPFKNVLEPFWQNKERAKRIVIINGKHKPKSFHNELYGRRLEAIAKLSSYDLIDLYGHGWERLLTTTSLWWPYLKNYQNIMRVYKGSCESKYETLSKYQFCLCFENMIMDGYVTEKLFDCLYAGTIPIYLGALNIEKYVPENVYIDFRKFNGYSELVEYIHNLSDQAILEIKHQGRKFIESPYFKTKYYDSLSSIFELIEIKQQDSKYV